MTKRCGWVKMNNPLYVAYHDEEWGKPLHDDQKLFELLCMETIRRDFLGRLFSINARLFGNLFISMMPRKLLR